MKVSGFRPRARWVTLRRRQNGKFSDNPRMYRLIGVVVSIGIADSLNPTTIAPALFLASGERPREQVARFALGVFLVYFVGGVVILLGPGELILALVPRPRHTGKHVIEIVAGVAMVIASVLLWRKRAHLSRRHGSGARLGNLRGVLLGAMITAVELPTAFPYFAAIAAIVGSGLDPGRQVVLLLLFDLCFVAPLLMILATLWLAREHAAQILTAWRNFLQRHWPVLLSGVALLAGIFVVLLGITGLLVTRRGDVGGLARGVRHLFHLGIKP